MKPPLEAVASGGCVSCRFGPDMIAQILEGQFVECGFVLRHIDAEVDDVQRPRLRGGSNRGRWPHGRTTSELGRLLTLRGAVNIFRAVSASISKSPFAEGAHETELCILRKNGSSGRVHTTSEVWVNVMDGNAIERRRMMSVILGILETHDGNMNCRAIAESMGYRSRR